MFQTGKKRKYLKIPGSDVHLFSWKWLGPSVPSVFLLWMLKSLKPLITRLFYANGARIMDLNPASFIQMPNGTFMRKSLIDPATFPTSMPRIICTSIVVSQVI